MSLNSKHRLVSVVSLVPQHSGRLLDIGCGPIGADYPYSNKAEAVTCLDWRMRKSPDVPSNVECIEGNFIELDLPNATFDAIVAADVFEHIPIESEQQFVDKCVRALRPGGHLIVSVPHLGAFAWLDPYEVKPFLQRLLWHVGLYETTHNGYCDIRKGHKHYLLEELAQKFVPLNFDRAVYWGYVFDPILSWNEALCRSFPIFGRSWIENLCEREFRKDWGTASFNIAVRFTKAN